MPAEPLAEPLYLPPGYGRVKELLAWEDVRRKLEEAKHYWLGTVRPDGRPHAVPLDGIWLDDAWYFGGSHEAVKHRNLLANPAAVLHLPDATGAVIVEGACEEVVPADALARELAARSRAKYGYAPDPRDDAATGVWCLRPVRALAWERFPRDATRFVFGRAAEA